MVIASSMMTVEHNFSVRVALLACLLGITRNAEASNNVTSCSSAVDCLNGGSCTNNVCFCDSGFQGFHCEVKVESKYYISIYILLALSLGLVIVLLIGAVVFFKLRRRWRQKTRTPGRATNTVAIPPPATQLALLTQHGYDAATSPTLAYVEENESQMLFPKREYPRGTSFVNVRKSLSKLATGGKQNQMAAALEKVNQDDEDSIVAEPLAISKNPYEFNPDDAKGILRPNASATASAVTIINDDKSTKTIKDQAIKDQAIKDQAIKDQAIKDQAIKDQAIKDQAIKNQAIREQAIRHQAIREQAIKHQAIRDQAIRDQAIRDQAIRDQAIRDQATRDQATRDQAIKDKAHKGKKVSGKQEKVLPTSPTIGSSTDAVTESAENPLEKQMPKKKYRESSVDPSEHDSVIDGHAVDNANEYDLFKFMDF